MGGKCLWRGEVTSADEYQRLRTWAEDRSLPFLHIGEATNILVSDKGYQGLVIRNRITQRERQGKEVEVGGGESLSGTIRWLNRLGLSGLERMYGIPGTVAGAVVGNAGAYGQEISDTLVSVTVSDGQETAAVPSSELAFGYRHSLFKTRRDWFILSCRLRLQQSTINLQRISDEILAKRLVKYPAGLKCPGSFFKNVLVRDLSPEARAVIPGEWIVAGRIPAGRLLEAVGARGARRGDACFAGYHGNLLMNLGQATSEDIVSLAEEHSKRVLKCFHVQLEPEVFLVDGFPSSEST